MIDKTKTYRTRNGMDARVYSTDGAPPFCVHGAMYIGDAWVICSWDGDGHLNDGNNRPRDLVGDLIEVKSRIKRTVWVNIYPNDTGPGHPTREGADSAMGHLNRLACIRLDIDCEHGEGLSATGGNET